MASRTFTQHRNSLEKVVVDLFAQVSFGNTGSPTLNASHSKGVTSITRSSAGKYVITLDDRYQRLLWAGATFSLASGSPAAPVMFVVDDSSDTASKQITVQFVAPQVTTSQFTTATTATLGYVATDPANGENLALVIQLSNSTAL